MTSILEYYIKICVVLKYIKIWFWFIVFNATFNNIIVISRRPFYRWRKSKYSEKTSDLSYFCDFPDWVLELYRLWGIFAFRFSLFGSSLPAVACRGWFYLHFLVFVYVEWCPTYSVLCFCFVFSSSCVTYFFLDWPLRYSLTFANYTNICIQRSR